MDNPQKKDFYIFKGIKLVFFRRGFREMAPQLVEAGITIVVETLAPGRWMGRAAGLGGGASEGDAESEQWRRADAQGKAGGDGPHRRRGIQVCRMEGGGWGGGGGGPSRGFSPLPRPFVGDVGVCPTSGKWSSPNS